MKALVYQGPGIRVLDDKPKPAILKATDAIVRITTTTICGTDLHILKGDLPTVTNGRILGHEGVGIIEEVGENVLNFHKGDKVLISCITSCGRCNYCRKGMLSHCITAAGSWETRSTGPKPSMSGSPMQIIVYTFFRLKWMKR